MVRLTLLLLLFAETTADWISQPWTKELYDKYDNIEMSRPGALCFQKGVFASKDDIKAECIDAARNILPDQVDYSSVCSFLKHGKPWFDPFTSRKCSTYCLWLVDKSCFARHCPGNKSCDQESMDKEFNCAYTYMRDQCGPRCEDAVKNCGPDATPVPGTTSAPETTTTPETTATPESAPAKGLESTESSKNSGNSLMYISTWIVAMAMFLTVLTF
ncbi:hypothetical protein DdX_18490 [Ditylenchus destructor]|uniref:Uncharacterized protein n=1 Tax=Ditylenchus destructor TaxID=166010 RepID=A0AAD4QY83_9BILA|nr:hypothetical protein DdX_18490 [Ditylenchus destructor]